MKNRKRFFIICGLVLLLLVIVACAGGPHERRLRQQLADIYRQLGDDDSARMVLTHS